MNLLLLSASDNQGGAAIATYRLHRGLHSIGIKSRLLVQAKNTDDESVIGPHTKLQRFMAFIRPHLDQVKTRSYPERDKALFSPACVPDRLAVRVVESNPDIVHLFWVNKGFLGIETLRNFNRPIVWTLHDMWPFTGGCHYDNECGKFRQSCGNCPVLHSEREQDLSRSIWERKRKSWEGMLIVVVSTSRWLADMARSSSLFRNYRIEVIPNGLDTDRYKPIDKKVARATYNLPHDKQLILFSALSAVSEKRKGNHFLVQALEKMSKVDWGARVELVIIGASRPETPLDLGMKVHYMGYLQDEISQVLLYSAADVVVAPSLQENLSNTVMESLACGTPVVAFNIGGMPDMIDHQMNGYLARPFETDDLAEGIMWVLENTDRRNTLSQRARQTVLERYALKIVANRYLSLYQSILK